MEWLSWGENCKRWTIAIDAWIWSKGETRSMLTWTLWKMRGGRKPEGWRKLGFPGRVERLIYSFHWVLLLKKVRVTTTTIISRERQASFSNRRGSSLHSCAASGNLASTLFCPPLFRISVPCRDRIWRILASMPQFWCWVTGTNFVTSWEWLDDTHPREISKFLVLT